MPVEPKRQLLREFFGSFALSWLAFLAKSALILSSPGGRSDCGGLFRTALPLRLHHEPTVAIAQDGSLIEAIAACAAEGKIMLEGGKAEVDVGGQLRCPAVWCAQRHALGHGAPALPARRLHAAQDRLLR